jgi:hypothetical protein
MADGMAAGIENQVRAVGMGVGAGVICEQSDIQLCIVVVVPASDPAERQHSTKDIESIGIGIGTEAARTRHRLV